MTQKKLFTIIILALGAVMILTGIILLFQCNAEHTGAHGGVTRASTSIEFGGDFYTHSAQYTGLAANAVVDLYKLTSIIGGIFFIFIGAVDICVTLLLTGSKANPQKESTVLNQEQYYDQY